MDHSYVQTLVDDGELTEEEANAHPQSNMLMGCLGAEQDPPLEPAPHRRSSSSATSLMACSDGLWHYFTPKELGAIVRRPVAARGDARC